MTIRGCAITDYVLELTRVCNQGPHERNYHVFYQLIRSRGDELLRKFTIEEPQAYAYLKGSQPVAPGIDDMACFEELKDAFMALGFTDEIQIEIFKVVLGILALGNVDFSAQEEVAELTSEDAIQQAASLLGLEKEALRNSVILRRTKVGTETMESKRSVVQAKATRDTYARLLYSQTFKWLIQRMNDLLGEESKTDLFFGVLDIAGFESFDHNSLEQLFINLSNEMLQQHFNQYFFKMELLEYEAEGITVHAKVTYADNSDIVALISAKGGILSLLDDEALIPKTTDEGFVSKMVRAHEKHARLVKGKIASGLKFGIQHFAGIVTYSAEGFLEKNNAKLPDEAPSLLQSSSLSLLKEVGARMAQEVREAEAGTKGRKAKTVSSGFRASLAELMQQLNAAEPHFVRCVKPNAEKVAMQFDSKSAYEQMLNSGIFEAVRIRQEGFPIRLSFDDMVDRYRLLIPRELLGQFFGLKALAGKERAEALLAQLESQENLSLPEKSLLLGKTKVFGTAGALKALESGLHSTLKKWKGEQATIEAILEKAVEGRDLVQLTQAISEGEAYALEDTPSYRAALALVTYLEQRQDMLMLLAEEVRQRNLQGLRLAVAAAEAFELDGAEDAEFQQALQEAKQTMIEVRKPAALAALAQAVKSRDMDQLRDALAEGEQVPLTESELETARVVLKQEERKVAAQAGLEEPMRSRELEPLRAAIAEGEAAGLEGAELEAAKTILQEEERKIKAAKDLEAAIEACQIDLLEQCLKEAEDAGLEEDTSKGALLFEARRKLAEERSKAQARQALEKAVSSRVMEDLRASIAKALEIGLTEGELETARLVLAQEEAKEAAVETLTEASVGRDIQSLQGALDAAKAANLDPAHAAMETAKKVLREEEQKEKARSALGEAIGGRTIEMLSAAIAEGKEAGLDGSDPHMKQAGEILAEEQCRADAKANLDEALKKLQSSLTPEFLDDLRTAIQTCTSCGVPVSDVTPATEQLAKAELKLTALEALVEAQRQADIGTLQKAIEDAKTAGLSRESYRVGTVWINLSEVESQLATLERKAQAVAGLARAADGSDAQQMRAALAEAESAGVAQADMADCKRALEVEERKMAARDALKKAVLNPSVDELRRVIAEAIEAGVDAKDLREAQQCLAQEERKALARDGLSSAREAEDVEQFRQALAEAEAAKLAVSVLQDARRELTQLERNARVLAKLTAAVKSRVVEELNVAISEAQAICTQSSPTGARKLRKELEEAEKLRGLEVKKAAARTKLVKAQNSGLMESMREALAEAEPLLDAAELVPTREALAREERKAAARRRLAEACKGSTSEPLRRALEEAEAAGLESEECKAPRKRLKDLQLREEAMAMIQAAEAAQDVPALEAAIQAGQKSGLTAAELEKWKERLRELQTAHIRQELKQATKANDASALIKAIAQSEYLGFDGSELEAAKATLASEMKALFDLADQNLEAARHSLLPAAGELAFQVARRHLQAEGGGGIAWKFEDEIAFGNLQAGRVLTNTLEEAWNSKPGTILDELCANLRTCVYSPDGKPIKAAPLSKTVLLRLGIELQLRHEETLDQLPLAAKRPLVLATMLLYTQQDVDLDRVLLFSGCPSTAGRMQAPTSARNTSYEAYRERVNHKGAKRNPMLCYQATQAAGAVLQAALSAGRGEMPEDDAVAPLRTWVKLVCLLGACRQHFEEPRTVTRCFLNISDVGMQMMKSRKSGDVMVCPPPLSSTLDQRLAEELMHQRGNPESHCVLTVSNVVEGLELFPMSQYPDEQELLLPVLSVLQVLDVRAAPGEPLRLHCRFQGTLMSKNLENACLFDLETASYELLTGYDWAAAGHQADVTSPKSGGRSPSRSPAKRPMSPDRSPKEAEGPHYTAHNFQSLFDVFEAVLSRNPGFKRILRICASHFANSEWDLTLHHFFNLAMHGASASSLERAMRWAARKLQRSGQKAQQSSLAWAMLPGSPLSCTRPEASFGFSPTNRR
eukprot:TRINITY_DN23113_c0_g1_i1.p1 TRINITY_DN23113_c0_g1~~TRINITY_DN23113_c0_g1_i1.p1  ORF type:complete len:2255 (-),score=582.31 TRINITY_DN23113_c0_g1_i1:175-6126(-)